MRNFFQIDPDEDEATAGDGEASESNDKE